MAEISWKIFSVELSNADEVTVAVFADVVVAEVAVVVKVAVVGVVGDFGLPKKERQSPKRRR